MPYAVMLFFDEESTVRLENIREALRLRGVEVDEAAKPHISLAIYHDLDVADLRVRLEKFARTCPPEPLRFGSIGVFPADPPVVFLAPIVSCDLLDLHARFHAHFADYASEEWDYYRPGVWVPHCTLALQLDERAFRAMGEVFKELPLPRGVTVERIGVLGFSPNNPLFDFVLEGGATCGHEL